MITNALLLFICFALVRIAGIIKTYIRELRADMLSAIAREQRVLTNLKELERRLLDEYDD